MTDREDKEAAYFKLTDAVPLDAEPAITDEEMEIILERHKRAVRWSSGASVVQGDLVLPTVRNGHVYRVTIGGALAATEGTWPLSDFFNVVNGAVTLQEWGADFSSIYDVTAAKKEACALKMARAAELHEQGEDVIFQNWKTMAASFSRPRVL